MYLVISAPSTSASGGSHSFVGISGPSRKSWRPRLAR